VVVPQCPLDQSWVNAPWIDASYILAGTTISWPLEAALDLVDSLISALPMDTTRLYVTGLSMGGYGSFDCILRFPEKFAAAIPMSGGGDPTEIGRILDVPVWAFHGDRDTSVPVSGSRDMMTAVENAGRPVTHTHCYMGSCNADPAAVMDSAVAAEAKHLYTEYKGKAHVIWAESYDLPQVHQWLFAQSTSSMSAVSPSAPDAVPIEFALFQNFPNPFNPATRISYTLNGPCRVRIEVFDASGRLVSALKDGPEPAGEREAVFDANGLSSGPYVVALSVDGKLRTRKMMLVK
jgi:dienelactone hydrolase